MSVDTALEYYKKGDYKKAIDEFSIVLETHQDNAELSHCVMQISAILKKPKKII